MFTKLLKNRKVSYVIAIFCTLLWGTAFPFIKLGYSCFAIDEGDIGSKFIFAGLRFFIAGIMVFFADWIIRKKPPKLKNTDIKPVAVLGLVQTAGQYIFTYIGIGFTSGTNTSIITACASFFTVLFVPLFFKSDRLTILKIAGCLSGFAGVLVVNGIGTISLDTVFGDICILFSTIFTSAGNIVSKKVATNRDPFVVTAYQLIIGSVIIIICGIICGGGLNLANLYGIIILLWLSFVSAVAFSLWTALLKYHPASKISVFNLLVPIFGTVLSGMVLGETVIRLETLIALALISAGIVLVNMTTRKRRSNLDN